MGSTRKAGLRWGAMLGACAALLSQAACGTDSTAPLLGSARLVSMTADVGLYSVTVKLGDAQPSISIKSNRFFCSGRTLAVQSLSDSTQKLQLRGSDSCGSFRLDLEYVAAAPCRPGGLFLVEGSVDGVTYFHRRMLASWNEEGRPEQPWITAQDKPVVVRTSSARVPTDTPVLGELGRWTYSIDDITPDPPAGCSLATDVELQLRSADTTAAPRVHRYTITESHTGGALSSNVTAATAGAPLAIIEQTGGIRRLSFPELDALRDSRVQAGLAYPDWNPAPAGFVSTAPSMLFVRVAEPVNLASGRESGQPLEWYLFALLDDVLAPFRAVATDPSVTLRVEVSLRVPLKDGMSVRMPVILVPGARFVPGDHSDCEPAPPGSVVCTVAAAVKAFDQAQPELPPDASYEFGFTFMRWTDPLLAIEQAQLRRDQVAPLR